MGVGTKMWLLPLPFTLATAVCSCFWNLGQITGVAFLATLTAVFAYPLILFPLLFRFYFPIRYRPLLSSGRKLVSIPLVLVSAILAGWIWVLTVDHGGAVKSMWDLCWWCGLISMICASLTYL